MLSISAALDEKDILFSISDLAREFGVTTRAIRFYEDEGLLSPGRSGRQRVYTSRDHVRLKLIVRGKRLGFSLSEVREIIEMYDLDSGENGQLRYFLEQIKKRREALQQQRYDIELTLGELDSIESECKHRLSALS
ncbi:MAG: MerR family DNA-binding transcriptional regulator [Proteobacteria bacterium]|nr:MerR family DNA-binding transcriptional regulator [Pseudomonadota bacterium]MBT4356111.1 MerR family DNA-binding transcriptional regulator [Pseudomonadota bacterium]MBT4987311.1 MerR family DNA-binding transcriptional regulator [Pseudomonadota bacterium]MBT5625312.1 MerR family DNA-binding transcriptional regulator [Pseudomonadota bacterium]MBT6066686.1 MerR family DNA-binding transcriptional regulator [Pseudomonadota bacterium]